MVPVMCGLIVVKSYSLQRIAEGVDFDRSKAVLHKHQDVTLDSQSGFCLLTYRVG